MREALPSTDRWHLGAGTRGTGPGLTKAPSGQLTHFTVFGRDRYQNPSSGGTLTVLIEPDNQLPTDLTITEIGGGEYRVMYTPPPESGAVKLSVAIEGGKHIYNSPFSVFISPGEAVPEKCEAAGRGVIRGGVDMDCPFFIHARDEVGNHLLEGGLRFAVSVYPDVEEHAVVSSAALKVDCTVSDLGNGVYACSYRPLIAGRHTVRVQLANTHIAGSPFTATVFELPEWEIDEVAQWVEGLGYAQYAQRFINCGIRGFMLPGMTVDMLEQELGECCAVLAVDFRSIHRLHPRLGVLTDAAAGIFAKGHQSMMLQSIKQRVATDEIDVDTLPHLDSHSLLQLGVTDSRNRYCNATDLSPTRKPKSVLAQWRALTPWSKVDPMAPSPSVDWCCDTRSMKDSGLWRYSLRLARCGLRFGDGGPVAGVGWWRR